MGSAYFVPITKTPRLRSQGAAGAWAKKWGRGRVYTTTFHQHHDRGAPQFVEGQSQTPSTLSSHIRPFSYW